MKLTIGRDRRRLVASPLVRPNRSIRRSRPMKSGGRRQRRWSRRAGQCRGGRGRASVPRFRLPTMAWRGAGKPKRGARSMARPRHPNCRSCVAAACSISRATRDRKRRGHVELHRQRARRLAPGRRGCDRSSVPEACRPARSARRHDQCRRSRVCGRGAGQHQPGRRAEPGHAAVRHPRPRVRGLRLELRRRQAQESARSRP